VPIYRSFDETELEPELRSCGVSGTVLVQSMDRYHQEGGIGRQVGGVELTGQASDSALGNGA
jgi:hypothetical protein